MAKNYENKSENSKKTTSKNYENEMNTKDCRNSYSKNSSKNKARSAYESEEDSASKY